jgi:hypothetical protein
VWHAGRAEYDAVGLPPILHMAAVDSHVDVSGESFTPGVALDLTLTVKSAPFGVSNNEFIPKTVTTNSDGAFFRTEFDPTTPINEITALIISTTDPATGQEAEKTIDS